MSLYYFAHHGDAIELDLSTEEFEKLEMISAPKMKLSSSAVGIIGHAVKLALRPYKTNYRQTEHTLIIQFFDYPKFCCGFVDHKDYNLQVWREV